MTDRELADIICRSLISIVAGIRKRYNLPEYKGVTIEIKQTDTIAGVTGYENVTPPDCKETANGV